MVQALELTLDRTGDERVRAEWRALAEAGLPSLDDHTGATNRPHLTLDVRDHVHPETEPGLPALLDRLPLRLQLGSVLLFRARRRWVVARHVVVDRPLLDLHEAVAAVLGPGSSPLTATGSWIPHVSVARNVSEDQLPAVLEVLSRTPAYAVTARRLRRWDQDARRAWDVGQASGDRSL